MMSTNYQNNYAMAQQTQPMQSLSLFQVQHYMTKICPVCQTQSTSLTSILCVCGEPLLVHLDTELFQSDLAAYLADLKTGKLNINKNTYFRSVFNASSAPLGKSLADYLEQRTVSTLLRAIVNQHFPRLLAEVSDLIKTQIAIELDLRNIQTILKQQYAEWMNTEAQLASKLLKNPFLMILDQYAVKYGDYQVKKRMLIEAATKSDTVTPLEKELLALREQISTLTDALEHQEDIRQRFLEYQASLANLEENQFLPTVARMMDEYRSFFAACRGIIRIDFHNGRPIEAGIFQ